MSRGQLMPVANLCRVAVSKVENVHQRNYKRSLSTYIKVTQKHSAFYRNVYF